MAEETRLAIALVAFISGIMGFVESMAALPAASTALAADALGLLQQSVNAGLALWAIAGVKRQRWTVWLQGLTMIALGFGVVLIAVGRFVVGSHPIPEIMAVIGALALVATLASAAIMLKELKRPANLKSVWHYRSHDVVGHVAVLAAAVTVFLTESRIPDVVIGGAMAAIFLIAGWQALTQDKLDEQF
jgi:Co/Zn/Cd efflux system component